MKKGVHKDWFNVNGDISFRYDFVCTNNSILELILLQKIWCIQKEREGEGPLTRMVPNRRALWRSGVRKKVFLRWTAEVVAILARQGEGGEVKEEQGFLCLFTFYLPIKSIGNEFRDAVFNWRSKVKNSVFKGEWFQRLEVSGNKQTNKRLLEIN